jgi:hypothetical protein
MKKKLILLLISILIIQGLQGQSRQKKELLLQIAALKVYMEYGQKGYAAIKKGLNFIGDIKKGEVHLHNDYFFSLLKVNPKVKNYVKVGEIVYMQIKIFKTCKKNLKQLHSEDLFHGDELDYMQRSFDRLLENSNRILNELIEVTTDAALEMKDDQRIERIDGLHRMMMDDYAFCLNFCRDARLLSMSKAKEKNDVKSARALLGL